MIVRHDEGRTPPDDRRGSTVASRLGVLDTKLVPPRVRPGIVSRHELVARLGAAPQPMLALIGPAGYGKSTVAAEYGRLGGRPLAWLSIDARDSDPATLVRGVAAAIARVQPIATSAIDAIAQPGPSPWSIAMPALAGELARLPPSTIVVDDADRLLDDEAVDVLLSLFGSIPDGGRLVVTGRSTGRLPWPRLEASGTLATFGREDLALDAEEAAAVLDALGLRAVVDAEAVTAATEGWAAGVYLRALAAAAGPAGRGGDDTFAAPTAPGRLIEEYLRGEVLATLPPDDAELIVRASVLDRWSGPLCDAALERSGSGAALDRLERSNLFVIPLDEERTWFRPHHLLGEVFRADLERRAPADVRSVLGRAARWHLEQGLPEQALEDAMQAGDDELAARLTMQLAQMTLNSGRQETARRWFAWFDERGGETSPPRFVSLATLLFSLSGDATRTERWAAMASASAATAQGVDAGVLAIARVCILADGIDAAVRDGELAVRSVPVDDPLGTAALTTLGLAQALSGRPDLAVPTLAGAVERWDSATAGNLAGIVALAHLAAIALATGDRVAAEAHVRHARTTVAEHGLTEQPIAGVIDALDARLAIAHGAVEQARRSVAHAQRLRTQTGVAAPWLAMRLRLDLIRVLLAMGDGGGARTLLAEIDELLRLRPDLGTLVDETAELRAQVDAVRGGTAGASTLTMAELRLLPLLTTHLTFREIGERLFVSQNTVKTQAISIYRKLDATSRGEAVERATEMGLLGAAGPERFIPPG